MIPDLLTSLNINSILFLCGKIFDKELLNPFGMITLLILSQPWKAEESIVLTLKGMATLVNCLQLLNTDWGISLSWLGKIISFRAHLAKHAILISSIELGKLISDNFVQSSNALPSIDFRVLGKSTFCKFVHLLNVYW